MLFCPTNEGGFDFIPRGLGFAIDDQIGEGESGRGHVFGIEDQHFVASRVSDYVGEADIHHIGRQGVACPVDEFANMFIVGSGLWRFGGWAKPSSKIEIQSIDAFVEAFFVVVGFVRQMR